MKNESKLKLIRWELSRFVFNEWLSVQIKAAKTIIEGKIIANCTLGDHKYKAKQTTKKINKQVKKKKKNELNVNKNKRKDNNGGIWHTRYLGNSSPRYIAKGFSCSYS